MARLTILLLAALVGGLFFVEVTMRPTSGERFTFAAIFGAVALFALLTTPLLLRLARSSRRFRDALTVAASTAVFVGVAVISVAAAGMFLSDHDLRLTLVSLAVGTLIAIAQLWALSAALASDLGEVETTVAALASGDLDARSRVTRNDEIGRLSKSVDVLARRLHLLETERRANETARTELLANVGHDLRTPLASMRVAVEALQDGLAPDPVAYLASIDRDIEHLSLLVDDLFLISQLDSGASVFAVGQMDLSESADETVEALRPLADRRGVHLELDIVGSSPCTGDPSAVGRVLRNIVGNAIRHADHEVRLHVRADADGAAAVVRDDGPGFPPGLAPFERFSRGDDARARDGSGAGLGLAIADRISGALGGDLSVLEGPGGAVRLRLPGVRSTEYGAASTKWKERRTKQEP